MWIEYIELQNIRSYVQVHIPFQRGVNFISGANGAGKTTIIEAIGLTLFGSKAASSRELTNYFLRYGEKKGRITIGVCVQNQGKIERFEVQRLIGVATTYRVFDENGQLDLSGQADVYAFLKQKFSLKDDDNLSALFENVIGIRQGVFTAPFLAAPEERKKQFDTILQLDHYRTTAKNSKGLLDELKKRRQEKSEQLAYLDGRLLQKNEVTNTYQAMQTLIQEQSQAFESLEIEYKSIQEQYLYQKEKQEKYINSENQWKIAISDLDILKKGCLLLQERNNESIEAFNRKKELEPHERVFLDISNQLMMQKENKEKSDHLKQKYELLKNTWEKENERIALGERHAKESMQQAEQKREDAQTQLQQEQQKEKDFESKLEQLKEKETLLYQNELTLKEIKERFEQLETVDRNVNILLARIQEQQQQEQLLAEKLQQKNRIQKQLMDSEEKEIKLLNLQSEQQKLQSTIEKLQSDLEKFQSGECPYTNEPCETVRSLESDAQEELQQAMDGFSKNQLQQHTIERGLQPSDVFKRNLIQLEKDHDIYEELIQHKNQWISQGKELLQQASNITKEDFKDSKQLNEFIIQTKEEISSKEKNLRKEQVDYADSNSRLEALTTQNQREINRLLQQIELADCEIKTQANQLDLQREERKKQDERLHEMKIMENEQTQYDDLEELLISLNKQLEEYQPLHDEYIKNVVLAERAEQDQEALQQAQQQIEYQANQVEEFYQLFLEAQKQFDLEQLEQLKQERANITIQISQLQVRLEEKKEQFREIEQKKTQLEKLESERKELAKELEKLDHLYTVVEGCRKIYEKTGERMARLLCEQLGHEANRYYRALSGEETQLIWAENYEIELRDWQDGVLRKRGYRTLSGGEQISAGLALRLALLKNLSSLGIAFFDEPTTHLDVARRRTLADLLPTVMDDFSQVFFVSHDDTFDAMAENMISIGKTSDGSIVL